MTPGGAGPSDPAGWVTAAGLTGAPEFDLLRGFCERAVASGIPIRRAQILIDTLHRVHEGRLFRWRDDRTTEIVEYGRTSENEGTAERWRQSPFYRLEQTRAPQLRRKLAEGADPEFPVLSELRDDGQTDYLACAHRFAGTPS